MIRGTTWLVTLGVLAGSGTAVWRAVGPDDDTKPLPPAAHWPATDEVNERLVAVAAANDLIVLRRLHLALVGAVPSLEEIRRFEALRDEDRLDRWTALLLQDPRHHRYFAARLARVFVGAEKGPFIVFRRDRFESYLESRIAENQPYDELVRELITARGLWTGQPAANFVTAAIIEGQIDRAKLLGRTTRAFLGQAVDCAQCHDHPFDDWTQTQFNELAAFFDGTTHSPLGVRTRTSTRTGAVPFGQSWLPDVGEPREKLAAWITHPSNERFGRAIANRIWGLMFGRPHHTPVDDLIGPERAAHSVLDVLGRDFVDHGHDLRRLIRTIAATHAFRADAHAGEGSFPISLMRPEQQIGALIQASSARTLDLDAHLVVRAIRVMRENKFIEEYGDLRDHELDDREATIPQALLRMNGKLVHELMAAQPFTLPGRAVIFATLDDEALDTIYLALLTRRPTPPESERFLSQLRGTEGDERADVVTDIAWALVNAPEFSWNH